MELERFAKILIDQDCLEATEAEWIDETNYKIALESYKLNCDVETVLNWDGELPDRVTKFWVTDNTETQLNLLMQIRYPLTDRDWETSQFNL